MHWKRHVLMNACILPPDTQRVRIVLTRTARYLSRVSSPTQFRCGPTSPSPSSVVDLRQSVSNGPCDDCTPQCPDEFLPSPTRPRRSNRSQFQRAGDLRCARPASSHASDESKVGSCVRSRRATLRSHCAYGSALRGEKLRSESSGLLRDCLCERDS